MFRRNPMFGLNRPNQRLFKSKPPKSSRLISTMWNFNASFLLQRVHIYRSKTPPRNIANASLLSSYKACQTLRFPRVEKIRDDKSWYECLDLNELEQLRTMAKGKLSYQHTSTSSEPAPKKRKRVVTRVEKPLTVAKHFAAADASGVQEVKKHTTTINQLCQPTSDSGSHPFDSSKGPFTPCNFCCHFLPLIHVDG